MKNIIKVGLLSIKLSREKKASKAFYEVLFKECEKELTDNTYDLILLPERAAVRKEDCQDLAGSIVGRFQKMAVDLKAYIIAPIVEKAEDKSYNTQVVISPEGELIHSYQKVHLAPGENATTLPGKMFRTFELPWFRAGLLICYDNQFPESSRCLAVQGAEVLFWPSFGDLRKPHRNIARCLDNNVYLLGAGVVDGVCDLPESAFETSQAISPTGEDLIVNSEAEGLFKVVELPLDPQSGKLLKPSEGNIYLNVRQPNAYDSLIN